MVYSRIAQAKRRKTKRIILGSLSLSLASVLAVFLTPQIKQELSLFTTKAEAEVFKTASSTTNASQMDSSIEGTTEVNQTVGETETASDTASDSIEETDVDSEFDTEVYTDEVYPYSDSAETASYSTGQETAVTTTSTTLSNGNTAGDVGTYAASQMEAATGVSQSVWEAIIARESNGDYTATNASGASGLFQTIPGWGSTATVDDQINSALNAYNAQGLAAWGY